MVRSTIGGLAVALGLTAFAAPALAAPANDDFEHAQVLADAPVEVAGTLAGASTQPGDPTGEPVDVWYAFTPTTSGPVAVEIPRRDNAVEGPPKVFAGADREHLVPVDAQDAGNWWGRTRFDAVAGRTYRIMVEGRRPEGTFALRLRRAVVPANDDFADARKARVPGLYHGSLEEATTELGEPSTTGRYTVWYRIRPRHSSRLTAAVDSAICDARVAAFTGSDLSSLHRIDERSFAVRFQAKRGRTYRLRVSCTGGYVGDYTLDISDGSIEGKGVHMSVKPGQTIHSVRHRGLRLEVGARRKVGVSIDLLVSRSTARHLHLHDRTLGHVRGRLGYNDAAPATIRLSRAARRALSGRHYVRATARLTLLDHAPDRVLEIPVRLHAR